MVFSTPKAGKTDLRQNSEASHEARRHHARLFRGVRYHGAVAHKMGRRWIMVELGEHCHTHIIPRMRKVIGHALQDQSLCHPRHQVLV